MSNLKKTGSFVVMLKNELVFGANEISCSAENYLLDRKLQNGGSG
jgi:hypothetical protein